MAFLYSFILSLFLWYQNSILKTPLRKSPQTIHKESTSRLGGIAIITALIIDSFVINWSEQSYDAYRIIVLCTIPSFITGLIDDLFFDIKPITRMILMLPTPLLLYYYAGIRITNLDMGIFDNFLNYEILSLAFLCFALVGMANAFNIIDGFNGLVLGYSLSVGLSLFFSGAIDDSFFISELIYSLFFAVLGVFIINFPFGKIFLGDGGAYLLGILIPTALIYYQKINLLSPWFVMLMLIYPFTEVLSSIIRKVFSFNSSAFSPDALHLHHLIYKRINKKFILKKEWVSHFFVTISIFCLNFPFLLAANIFSKNTLILLSFSVWYVIIYFLIYFLLLPKNIFRLKK